MIESHALTHQHPGGPLLAFGDLQVPQGGTLLLRGRSGAGKSTWLALAAGLLSVQSGRLIVAQQDLSALAPAARDGWRARSVGVLPQKLHLSEALTVQENLALPFYATGLPVDHEAIRQALTQLSLAELARRKPAQLSGGQAQRVALARSILLRPRVLLADEPTASLDDESAQAALDLLTGCAADTGATLVIATHDARVLQALPAATLHSLERRPRGLEEAA